MSESFAEDWLALREGADASARERATRVFLDSLKVEPGTLRVVDLGAGSGNNLAHLAPKLAAAGATRQEWTLVDGDERLLEAAARRTEARTLSTRLETLDLASALDVEIFRGATLVTASALFDLVSAEWIEHLLGLLVQARVPALWASLTVNGDDAWTPVHPSDVQSKRAFESDMRRDKGLGPSLGTSAPRALLRAIEAAGGAATTVDTPWQLGASAQRLQSRYLDDLTAVLGDRCDPDWRTFRRSAIDADRSELRVGHTDVLGLFGSARSMSNRTSVPRA